MSDFSLTLVLQIKTSKIINDMAKIQQKSEKITAFGGIFFVLCHFFIVFIKILLKNILYPNVFWNFACKGNKISCYSKNLNKKGLRVSRQTSPGEENAQRKWKSGMNK